MKLIVLIMSWMVNVIAVNYDCPYKECSCYMMHISCDNLGLEVLPLLTTTQPTVNTILALDENLITTIPPGSLPSGLTEISLLNNPITTIDETAFDGSSSTLQMLSFSNARFTRIPDAFLHLSSLNYLSIYNTHIQDWNENAMKHIGLTTTNLYLENVGLTAWPDWVGHFSHLSELSLIVSSISSLPDDALDNQINTLLTLSLINNNLTAVPKAVSKLRALQMLNLINTSISDLTYLPQSSSLTSLSLDNTSLSDHVHVSNTLRPFSQSLINVYLEGNQLVAVPDVSFLTKLGSIVLANNQIADPKSGSMPTNLYDIDLGYNWLPSIPDFLSSLHLVSSLVLPWNKIKALQGTNFPPSATDTDFSFNLITELTDTSFPQNSNIMTINLSGNPIIKVSGLAFQNLQHLTDLSMQNTKITRLPLSLAHLVDLKSLDLSDSSDLVCTCLESTLGPLLLSLYNLHGNCGEATIVNFFASMSSSCPST